MNPKNFTILYRFEEMLGATWLVFRRRWLWKGVARYILVMTVAMATILEITAEEHSVWGLIANGVTGMVVGVAGLTLTWLYWLWCIPRSVRKSYAQLALDSGRIEFTFDDHQLEIADATTTLRLPWDRWVKWSQNSDFLLLFRTDAYAHYVPKSQVQPDLVDAMIAHLDGAGVKRI
jgi:hypothetical protein